MELEETECYSQRPDAGRDPNNCQVDDTGCALLGSLRSKLGAEEEQNKRRQENEDC